MLIRRFAMAPEGTHKVLAAVNAVCAFALAMTICSPQPSSSAALNNAAVRLVPVDVVEHENVSSDVIGCFNHTIDSMAANTNSNFTFVALRSDSSRTGSVIQHGTSPYLTARFSKKDDGILIHCEPQLSKTLLHSLAQRSIDIWDIVSTQYKLHVLYPVTFFWPSNLAPAPLDTIECPFRGSDPIHFEWYMNTTGPFACAEGQDNTCSSCTTAGLCQGSVTKQAQCLAAKNSTCFTATANPNAVTIKYGCFGCLTCRATNTVNGIVYTGEFSYGLYRPHRPTKAPCLPSSEAGDAFKVDSVLISPSDNLTLGTSLVNISVIYEYKKDFVVVNVKNASTGQTIQHDSHGLCSPLPCEDTIVSFSGCKFRYSLLFYSPWLPAENNLIFNFHERGGEQKLLHSEPVTFSMTVRYCPEAGLCHHGRCTLDWFNTSVCRCDQGWIGRTCQFACPNGPNIPLQTSNVTVPEECRGDGSFTVDCSGPSDRPVDWYRNGVPLLDQQQNVLWLTARYIDLGTAGNYTCVDSGTGVAYENISVTVANTPVLADGLRDGMNVPVLNGSEGHVLTLRVNGSLTYDSGDLDYLWAAVDAGQCVPASRECIVDRQSPELQILQLHCCSGRYRGCVGNAMGTTCITIRTDVINDKPNEVPQNRNLNDYLFEVEDGAGRLYDHVDVEDDVIKNTNAVQGSNADEHNKLNPMDNRDVEKATAHLVH